MPFTKTSQHKTKKLKGKNFSAGTFSFIFLSLVLCLLCFFIYLVQNSEFEKVKVDALKVSLRTSFAKKISLFASNSPSFEASQIAIYHQNQIAKMFPASQIKQDLINDEISIFVPINSVFKETSTAFLPTTDVLFSQIASLLNNRLIKNKYLMDFILFEDIPEKENYPIFEHLTTQRLVEVAEKIKEKNVPENNFSIGLEKGNAAFIKLHFRKRRTS